MTRASSGWPCDCPDRLPVSVVHVVDDCRAYSQDVQGTGSEPSLPAEVGSLVDEVLAGPLDYARADEVALFPELAVPHPLPVIDEISESVLDGLFVGVVFRDRHEIPDGRFRAPIEHNAAALLEQIGGLALVRFRECAQRPQVFGRVIEVHDLHRSLEAVGDHEPDPFGSVRGEDDRVGAVVAALYGLVHEHPGE